MSIKTYIVKITSWSGRLKQKRRARKFLEDESVGRGEARIKNYPPRVVREDDPDYDMGIDY